MDDLSEPNYIEANLSDAENNLTELSQRETYDQSEANNIQDKTKIHLIDYNLESQNKLSFENTNPLNKHSVQPKLVPHSHKKEVKPIDSADRIKVTVDAYVLYL